MGLSQPEWWLHSHRSPRKYIRPALLEERAKKKKEYYRAYYLRITKPGRDYMRKLLKEGEKDEG